MWDNLASEGFNWSKVIVPVCILGILVLFFDLVRRFTNDFAEKAFEKNMGTINLRFRELGDRIVNLSAESRIHKSNILKKDHTLSDTYEQANIREIENEIRTEQANETPVLQPTPYKWLTIALFCIAGLLFLLLICAIVLITTIF